MSALLHIAVTKLYVLLNKRDALTTSVTLKSLSERVAINWPGVKEGLKSCGPSVAVLLALDVIIAAIILLLFGPLKNSLWLMAGAVLLVLAFIAALSYIATNAKRHHQQETGCRQIVFILTIVSVLALIVITGIQAGQQAAQPGGATHFGVLGSWAIIIILFSFLLLYVGFLKNGRWLGIIMDGRNQMSLSYFQVFIWTILIVSSLLAFALINIGAAPLLNNTTVVNTIIPLNNTTLVVGILNNTAVVNNTTLLTAVLNNTAPVNNTTLIVGVASSQNATNVTANYLNAVNISIPTDVLAILGITLASVVGKPLVSGVFKKSATKEEIITALKLWLQKHAVADADANTILGGGQGTQLPDSNSINQIITQVLTAVTTVRDDLRTKYPANEYVQSLSSGLGAVAALAGDAQTTQLWTSLNDWKAKIAQVPEQDRAAATDVLNRLENVLYVTSKLKNATFDGLVVINRDIQDALPSDIFTGDEIAMWDRVDLSKMQMFLFTTVLALAYAFAIAGMLTGASPLLQTFPNIDPVLAGFLAASNAGYLVYKGVPQ